ncbi:MULTISPECIES: recombinase family protein [unclassified Pseudomonas]|uniref:recombinase family protein n=1 Tax=unclassified Pseudomonas TaxID=196821 RepID=UPI002096C622|nr:MULTISPECIES: recombinase family protein [unclassified Pseudomonas]MCO7506772.1 recombinase family protein [Pseudomonas sp. VE 267-6A]MCO7531484.1 recombinase family protein [Pseudomonas sp. 2]
MPAAKHDSATQHRPCAIPYIRFSSARQTGGSSTERQQQMVIRWLNAHPEYTLSDLTFADLGKSGYHGEHLHDEGGFAKLLAAVEAGLIKTGDCVLVEAIDRAGRLSPMRMLREVISPIIEAGVSIITLDDNVTYNSASVEGGHLFLLVAKIQAAHGYSKQLSERTKASYVIRREQARATGKVKRHTPVWLTSDGVVIEYIAMHVRQAFELYVSGVGKTAIANRLRASGVDELKTCSGPTIEGWLRNKAAIGYWNDVKVYEPVVSDELFMLAQQRKKAATTKPRERTSKHFLVGLVKCGVCGGNYIIHHKDGQPNNMRCGTHHRLKAAGCTLAETIPYQVVVYLYSCTAHLSIGKALQTIRLSANDQRKLELTSERDELTASSARLAKVLAKIDSPEIEAELDSANARRKAIDEELSILDRVVEQPARKQTLHIRHDSAVEHDRMFKDDPVQLSALLRQAGYSITVQPERKLFVAGDDVPIIYVGTVRKGNQTLGYRVSESGHEFVISPVIPQLPTAFDHSDKANYLANRSAEIVSMKLVANDVEGE